MNDSLKVTRKKAVYTNTNSSVAVRSRYGLVYLNVGDKTLEMKTPTAHGLGMALAKQAGLAERGELVIVIINGVDVQFLPSSARQVGGALLRKADDADDYQLRVGQ